MTKSKILWPLILALLIILLMGPGAATAGRQKDDLDYWIDHLGRHENCAAKVVGGKLVGTMDSGSYSYGILCFKKETFISYVKRYNLLPYSEDEEIMNWIGDNQFQKALARRMILENYGNWRHWKTTTLYKIGYPPKI